MQAPTARPDPMPWPRRPIRRPAPGGASRRRADTAPDGAVAIVLKRRVAPTQAQTTDDREHVQRPPGRPESTLRVGHPYSLLRANPSLSPCRDSPLRPRKATTHLL